MSTLKCFRQYYFLLIFCLSFSSLLRGFFHPRGLGLGLVGFITYREHNLRAIIDTFLIVNSKWNKAEEKNAIRCAAVQMKQFDDASRMHTEYFALDFACRYSVCTPDTSSTYSNCTATRRILPLKF
jgi:hypothetical protein